MVKTSKQGFALLIAVGLIAFLALLLVSLGVLARNATFTSSIASRQALARNHARFALDIALGSLQQWAGPDQRVTASADAFAVTNSHDTGVWDATGTGVLPLVWLVSGNEGANPLAVTPSGTSADAIELVGARTSGSANDVVVPRQAIKAPDIPGHPGSVTVGNYAWWIGDQGVKAPVASPDRNSDVTTGPFASAELRNRLDQQLGAGSHAPEFEAASSSNAQGIHNLTTFSQLAFLTGGGGAMIGAAPPRDNFHSWSPDNLNVLADTKRGGLRRDISLRPDILGSAFASWANYPAYMEDPAGSPKTPTPSPDIASAESLRRRYRMTPALTDAGISHGVSPVLSYCLLAFNVRTDQSVSGGTRPVEVRARWMVSLWNPYTSALVPEDLQLEVFGLPNSIQVINDTAGGVLVCTFSLDAAYGSPLRIGLPWQLAGRDDQQSWFPGRVYTWAATENLAKAAPVPASGFVSLFYTRNLSATAGQGVQRPASPATMSNSAQAHISVAAPSQLTLRLYRAPPGGVRQLLAGFVSPSFLPFATTPATASSGTYQFAYFFRLAESVDTLATPETWLVTPGQDPREALLPAGSYVPGNNGNRPEQYPNFTSIAFPDRLLDRSLPATPTSATGQSYNEDVPLFELPRAPVLSMGALQHLHAAGTRPFPIGNSWGAASGWNALFDRYYFSGLDVNAPPADEKPLPDSFLHRVSRRPDGSAILPADLCADSLDGFSSKYLLERSAFNLNSANQTAWAAVLRSVRFPAPKHLTFLASTVSTGTAGDSQPNTLAAADAYFLRFSLSAQETFQADSPGVASTYAASTTVPPVTPNSPSNANTHLFRRGIRTLNATQVDAFAGAIGAEMRLRQAASGPFRSMEEFLNPSPLFTGPGGQSISLLEKAISDAGLNGGVPEFSSQWLTQGDIMTALAPRLFCRSDTFLIRSYGDAVNPATGEIEARAWLEAVVQRMPDYADPSNPPETGTPALAPLNQRLGRRFEIVSIRWLSQSDL